MGLNRRPVVAARRRRSAAPARDRTSTRIALEPEGEEEFVIDDGLDRVLFLDLETRSRVDLRATGVYVYADDPSTDVTVARLAMGMEEPVDGTGRELPARFVAAMNDQMIDVVAHNAQFERI